VCVGRLDVWHLPRLVWKRYSSGLRRGCLVPVEDGVEVQKWVRMCDRSSALAVAFRCLIVVVVAAAAATTTTTTATGWERHNDASIREEMRPRHV